MATPPIDKSIFYSPSSIPLMEKYDSMTNDFLAPYLNASSMCSEQVDAQKADTKRFLRIKP
jgi:hypothetical protein